MHRRIGDRCRRGENVCTVHASDEKSAARAAGEILSALTFSAAPCPPSRLIWDVVDENGVRKPGEDELG